ncbi:MAG TPA: argininosuccinate lyase [archaeon]|nr:argininosuccinate lyase [archaeon]
MAKKGQKAWGGRFTGSTDRLMEEFNASIGFDLRLWREDIEGSKAYAEALALAGIITPEESGALLEGLDRVAKEIKSEKFPWRKEDEDIHMAVERRLTELVGPVGGKLHTGRSRNDQVATDLRLWLKSAVGEALEALKGIENALITQAGPHLETLMPGLTHLQQAQVVSLAHYLLSFFWMFERDRSRFLDLLKRADLLPLGSGALAGHALGIDREYLARRLGFAGVSPNSMDAVSDRDFVAEFLSTAALCMVHLSRLAEDLIVFSSAGFRYVELSDSFTTGSSLMPQKKNPDALELVRGKTGRVIGRLTGLLTTLKGLPSTYNKDLQEDKEPLFDCFDTLVSSLKVTTGVVSTARFKPQAMAEALDDFLLATDLADYLVQKGLPFRRAHEVVGRLVRECEERKETLRELPLEIYQAESGLFGPDVKKVLDFKSSLKARKAAGGTAPEAVRAQLGQARQALAD